MRLVFQSTGFGCIFVVLEERPNFHEHTAFVENYWQGFSSATVLAQFTVAELYEGGALCGVLMQNAKLSRKFCNR